MKNKYKKQLATIYQYAKNNFEFHFEVFKNKKELGTLVLQNNSCKYHYSNNFDYLEIYINSCSESIQDLIYNDRDFENFVNKLIEKLESIDLRSFIKRHSHLIEVM